MDRFPLILPWGAIVEYLTLQDILPVRSVCREWQHGLEEGASLDWCVQQLSHILWRQNVFVFPNPGSTLDETWNIDATQSNTSSLINPTGDFEDNRSCLFRLLRIIRVLKYLPECLVVAFSEKYGRHCLPTIWNPGTKQSQPCIYAECQRPDCPTCKLQPPLRKSDEALSDIDRQLEIQTERGPLNLVHYTPKCIPNLPADLVCPLCYTADQRTLVLTEFSYKVPHSLRVDRPSHTPLKWTPVLQHHDLLSDEQNNDVTAENVGDNPNDMVASSPPSAKRSRLNVVREPEVFPPRYADMAIPVRTEPLQLPKNGKHCLSIHCVRCRKFAVWSPAAVCWNADFVCSQRGRKLSTGEVLGGALVRKTCSLPDCSKATSCPQCAHMVWHSPYQGSDTRFRRASHCDVCRETYCGEHSWVSTVCHHW